MTVTDAQVLAAMAAAAAPPPASAAAMSVSDLDAPPEPGGLSPLPALPSAVELPDVDRAARTVVAARALVAATRSDAGFPREGADELVAGLVAMIASTETQINALSAQRNALVAVAAAVVDAVPSTMVPMLPDAPVTAVDRDHARRALVADLATASGASEATTATVVDTSTALVAHLPGVLTAMGAGVLGDRHARYVVRHAEDLPARAMPAYEADVLARLGADRTPAGVGRTARAARERCHPRTAAERHERASRDRTVRLDHAEDGMAWLTAFLPAVQATAIFDKLTGIADVLGREDDEQRTVAQRRADALTALVLDPPSHAAATGVPVGSTGDWPAGDTSEWPAGDTSGSPAGRASDATAGAQDPPHSTAPPPWLMDPALHALRPTVAVTVPVLTLLGVSDEPGHLDGHGPIHPDTARALAAHASSFIRLLTHPETGTVLSVGRDRYAVPADLRTWLRLRDQTCRFPGCHRSAARSEIDHTVPFREHGAVGTTAADNLAHLCARHHRMKHTTRWAVTQDHEGRLTWTAPTGHTHTTEAALELTGPDVEQRQPAADAPSPRRAGEAHGGLDPGRGRDPLSASTGPIP